MRRIELETVIEAPPERCFDLSLSVEFHLESTKGTGERVVAGKRSGVLRLGDTVTWEARHFGLRRRLEMRISEYDRPRTFRDELVRGPFRTLTHDHLFEPIGDGTRMTDVFVFASIVPLLDPLLVEPHLRRLLVRRNELIKRAAEGGDWRRYLG